MLRWLLHILKSIWLGRKPIHRTQRFKSRRIDEDSISVFLPDDLLIKILLLLPPKVAVSTVVFSKRWRLFWTMQPEGPELIMHLKMHYRMLELLLRVETDVCCNTINFSQLETCILRPPSNLDWLETFLCFLHNSPKLKFLVIIDQTDEDFPLSFNAPSSVPACLSTNLEVFEWKRYGGQDGQKEMLRYIFSNSKCFKRADISIKPQPYLSYRKDRKNTKKKRKMEKELESMSRASPSHQLIFSTQSSLIV